MPESTKWDVRRVRIELSYSCRFLCREFVSVDWQSTQSDSRRREERVRQCRGRRRCARFADAAWSLAALDEMNLDLGRQNLSQRCIRHQILHRRVSASDEDANVIACTRVQHCLQRLRLLK